MRALSFVLIFASACSQPGTTGGGGGGTGGSGGGGGGGGGSGGGGGPDTALMCDASPPATAFSKVYSEIITPSCLGACHKAGAADGSDSYGVYTTSASAYLQVGKISAYAGTEQMLKIVDPNALGNSALYLKVLARAKSPSGKNLGGAMPLGAASLTAVQKQTLKDWICSGAQN